MDTLAALRKSASSNRDPCPDRPLHRADGNLRRAPRTLSARPAPASGVVFIGWMGTWHRRRRAHPPSPFRDAHRGALPTGNRRPPGRASPAPRRDRHARVRASKADPRTGCAHPVPPPGRRHPARLWVRMLRMDRYPCAVPPDSPGGCSFSSHGSRPGSRDPPTVPAQASTTPRPRHRNHTSAPITSGPTATLPHHTGHRRVRERGIVFEQAIAQSSWTLPAFASIFTGPASYTGRESFPAVTAERTPRRGGTAPRHATQTGRRQHVWVAERSAWGGFQQARSSVMSRTGQGPSLLRSSCRPSSSSSLMDPHQPYIPTPEDCAVRRPTYSAGGTATSATWSP